VRALIVAGAPADLLIIRTMPEVGDMWFN
jgi:hypothetical protein